MNRHQFLRRCLLIGFIGGMIPDPVLWSLRIFPFTWPSSIIAMAVGMVIGESLVASGMALFWIFQDWRIRRAWRRWAREWRRVE